MTRTNPRQPLWQRVKEEADYKTLGSAHDRQKLSTLADGARWEHGADAEKLATYAARHAAAQPAYDAAAARYAADDGDDDDRGCLLYTSPSPRDRTRSRMPSSA